MNELDERDEQLRGIHPGEILTEDFLAPLDWTPYRLAKELGVAYTRVEAILKGRRGISAETAHRLGRLFNTGPEFWLRLQNAYDLETALTPEFAAELAEVSPQPLTPVPGEAEAVAA